MKIELFDNRKVEIRPLTPLDFLDDDRGVFISMFKTKKNKTVLDLMDQEVPLKNKEELEKEFDIELLKSVVKKIIKDADELKDEEILFAYLNIFKISFKCFKKIVEINRSVALLIDRIAKRYGKTPSEIYLNEMEKTDMDKIIFDQHIFTIAIEEDGRAAKKRKAEIEREQLKKGR